eukprot:1157633-Pelagomonas_calceolata.AAC.4
MCAAVVTTCGDRSERSRPSTQALKSVFSPEASVLPLQPVQERALKAFHADPEKWGVNVQSLSGSPANFQVGVPACRQSALHLCEKRLTPPALAIEAPAPTLNPANIALRAPFLLTSLAYSTLCHLLNSFTNISFFQGYQGVADAAEKGTEAPPHKKPHCSDRCQGPLQPSATPEFPQSFPMLLRISRGDKRLSEPERERKKLQITPPQPAKGCRPSFFPRKSSLGQHSLPGVMHV